MKIYLDKRSYLDVKKDLREDKARITIKTEDGKESYILSALLDKDQIQKIISELVSIRAEI